MERVNRDVVIAILLLVFCGVFFWASFDIRQPDYGTLMPSTWPRVIIALLALLSVIYLVQSLKHGIDEVDQRDVPAEPGVRAWFSHWQNPLWCFGLFFVYLALMPVLGMLIGGIGFVFILLGVLGGWQRQTLPLHAAVAVIAVGGMWSLFTYGLGVILPSGIIFNPFG